jgi:hypothetical protein
MAAVFPASLPWFTRFVLSPAGQRAATQPPKHFAQRSSTTSGWAKAEVSWVFFEADRAAFEDWFRDDLNRGASWALMKLPITPGGIAGDCYSAVRFPNGYSKQLVVHGLWRVSAQIVIRDRFECALVDPCFVERFTSGLSPYSTVSGDAGIFSIAAGPSLAIATHGAGTVAAIERVLDAPIAVRTYTARFRVVSGAQPNDTPLAGLFAAGALKAYFIARREGDFDALRRCFASFDGESVAMSASAIDIGIWHEAQVEWAAGAGNTTYMLRRLDTSAVVGSGVFAGALAQPTIDTLRFRADADPGVFTCPIEYDYIEVCP